jgi:2-keto-4-pentenoate hydratase
MALNKDQIRAAAERLDQAEKNRKQIRQISLDHPGITIDDAYAIQKAWIEMKVAQGRVVKGHKIGLTSKAMQSASASTSPTPAYCSTTCSLPTAASCHQIASSARGSRPNWRSS